MITEFQNEYRWLSNFASVNIELDGHVFKSVEHAYCYLKTNDTDYKNICKTNILPGPLKTLSRGVSLKPNWSFEKDDIMFDLLTQKFNQEPYKTLLLNTNQDYIQEGNWWGDTYWGVDLKTGVGFNKLGEMIMKVRYNLLINEI